MKRMRISIAGLMVIVLVVGLGFAGLKSANQYWASGCFTLATVALVAAVLHAANGHGPRRAYWGGFAVAGAAYLGLIFGPGNPTGVAPPPLLTKLVYDYFESLLHPDVVTFSAYTTFTYNPTITTSPVTSSSSPPTTMTITAAPTPMFFPALPPTNMLPIHFSQVAHSLTALLAGMLGGAYSLWWFGRRGRTPVAATGEAESRAISDVAEPH